jgi:NAD(P)-dependent dehydrogenase (short-subunit alcohol dehydrogenase family)
MLLQGRVAIVSGAGPNIGREIASTLAENGARVVCLDVRKEAAEAATNELVDRGFEALAVQADTTVPDQVQHAIDQAVQKFGSVDILVNNAAITHRAGLLDADVESWRQVVDVILTGTFLCTQRAAKQMIAQGRGGCIVNIASTSGHRGKAGAIAYQTAKAGILNFTRGAAMELAPYGIRVNSVTPTQTGTPVGGGQARADDELPGSIPRGRWGRPRDQAQAVLFLVSDNADFILGVDLPVDGGNLAQRASG